MIKDDLRDVPPEWEDEFMRFVRTGEASRDFQTYLDKSTACQQAVEQVLDRQLRALVVDSNRQTAPGEVRDIAGEGDVAHVSVASGPAAVLSGLTSVLEETVHLLPEEWEEVRVRLGTVVRQALGPEKQQVLTTRIDEIEQALQEDNVIHA